MEFSAITDTHLNLIAQFDRVDHPAHGRAGGGAGAAGLVHLASGKKLNGKGRQTIPAGDRLVIDLPGGGGYGDPNERPLSEIAEDVKQEVISAASARRDYPQFEG